MFQMYQTLHGTRIRHIYYNDNIPDLFFPNVGVHGYNVQSTF